MGALDILAAAAECVPNKASPTTNVNDWLMDSAERGRGDTTSMKRLNVFKFKAVLVWLSL